MPLTILPLETSGAAKEHVCAFARLHGDEWVVVIVPRRVASLVGSGEFPVGPNVWGRSAVGLPAAAPTGWLNVLTGGSLETLHAAKGRTLQVGDVFRSFPVALLTGTSQAIE